ncbi:MAG: phosphatase [Bacteroidota bacterium]|jgi:3-deoxy-D-manno-octulosonate 8-phosphate phosphatase (KDO 8-P phosphatase)
MIKPNDFRSIGGVFLTDYPELKKKVKKIRAFVFDWDGVFNDGSKSGKNDSYFTEIDSMGTNLMRFGNWLMNNKKLPFCAIISGESNDAALFFIKREHFNAGYFRAKNKIKALDEFCKKYQVKSNEIAFFYDDVLDLPVAKKVGLRICMRRNANPVFNNYLKKNKLADYLTGSTCGNFALREACELVMFLQGNSENVLNERVENSELYSEFIRQRNSVSSQTKDFSEP